MPNAFGAAQAQLARYYYERAVFTGWPFAGSGGASSLPTGTTPLFAASRWNLPGKPTWQAALEMLQVSPQTAGVKVLWAADSSSQLNPVNDGDASAVRAGNRQMRVYVPGVDSLSLSLRNTTGAPVSGWQTNYAVSMRRLTALDKLMAQRAGYGGAGTRYDLMAEEQAALNALGTTSVTGLQQMKALEQKGTMPLSIERIMQGVYLNHLLGGPADLIPVVATSGDTIAAQYNAAMDPSDPTAGRFLVLTDLSVEGAPNVTVTIDRDGDNGYLQVNAAAFTQADDEPWHLWIPAVDHLTIHVTQGPGNNAPSTNTALRVRVLTLEMNDVVAVQFGRITQPSDLPGQLYYKVVAGVV